MVSLLHHLTPTFSSVFRPNIQLVSNQKHDTGSYELPSFLILKGKMCLGLLFTVGPVNAVRSVTTCCLWAIGAEVYPLAWAGHLLSFGLVQCVMVLPSRAEIQVEQHGIGVLHSSQCALWYALVNSLIYGNHSSMHWGRRGVTWPLCGVLYLMLSIRRRLITLPYLSVRSEATATANVNTWRKGEELMQHLQKKVSEAHLSPFQKWDLKLYHSVI